MVNGRYGREATNIIDIVVDVDESHLSTDLGRGVQINGTNRKQLVCAQGEDPPDVVQYPKSFRKLDTHCGRGNPIEAFKSVVFISS